MRSKLWGLFALVFARVTRTCPAMLLPPERGWPLLCIMDPHHDGAHAAEGPGGYTIARWYSE